MEVESTDERPDFNVYSLRGYCWVPMPGVEGIAGYHESQYQ